MDLLECLTPLAGRPAADVELDEAGYARLPLRFLADARAPFDVWHRPEHPVPAELEALWKRAAASHQLCAFHAVNAVTLGGPFAERVLGHQQRCLEELRPGLGAEHRAEILKFYDFASRPLQVKDARGGWLEVPTDWRIAVEFLLTCELSPFRANGAGFSVEGVPDFPDGLDETLAADLEHAWAVAAERFAGLLETVRTEQG
jgi:hypothetical protein